MAFTTFGTNSVARKQRVYYEGTSTIYEGMPLCYNQDTTDNILGYSKSSSAIGTTTAEGSQNEGKFLRVENPATANLAWFAGVVATTEHAGKTGPRWLDVYIPNGAIVPVRSYISSTVATNALAIMNGQQYLGNPNAGTTNGAARYVAVAMETVDRSATAGICLAKLCPDQFAYQSYGTTKLLFATAGTVDVAANFINVDSDQVSGGFTGLWVRSQVDTAGNSDTSLAIYGEANVNGVVASSWCIGNRFAINLWGGTQTTSLISGLMAEIYEEGANLTGGVIVAPFAIHDMVDATNPPAVNCHWLMYFKVNGADKPDGLFLAPAANDVGAIAASGDITFTSADKLIPVRIAGTTYYLVATDNV